MQTPEIFDRLTKTLRRLLDTPEVSRALVQANQGHFIMQARSALYAAETEPSCASCKFFYPGCSDSRWHPGEIDECGHPKYYALLTHNKNFPFERGCKHFIYKFNEVTHA